MKRRNVVSAIYLIMAIHVSATFINEPHMEEEGMGIAEVRCEFI